MKYEFSVGEIVIFQAYTDCKPITAKVIAHDNGITFNGPDDRRWYKLGGISSPLTSICTGLCIMESKLFSPEHSEGFFSR